MNRPFGNTNKAKTCFVVLLIQIFCFHNMAFAENSFPALSPILSLLLQKPDISKVQASAFLSRPTLPADSLCLE